MTTFEKVFRQEFDIDDELELRGAFLVADIGLDSLELFRLAVILEALSPGFEFPPQMELLDVTFSDVEHYLYSHLGGGPG